jgi:hypothetical protein
MRYGAGRMMMERYTPEYDFMLGEHTAHMTQDEDGEYIRIDDVIEWLSKQRNDVPMTGEEAANGLKYILGA